MGKSDIYRFLARAASVSHFYALSAKTFAPTGGLEFVYPTAPIKIQPADIPDFHLTNNSQAPSGANTTTPSSSSSSTHRKDTTYPSKNILGSGADGNNSASQDDAKQQLPDAFGWWIRRGEAEPFTYEGMETGFETVAEVLKNDGPFDGVMGFSQGGALAGMVASLLESGRKQAFEELEGTVEEEEERKESTRENLKDQKKASKEEKEARAEAPAPAASAPTIQDRTEENQNRRGAPAGGMPYPKSFAASQVGSSAVDQTTIHPPLRFAVSYSGFGASTNPLYSAFYKPPIVTPMLHFLGSVDTVVEEARSLRLVDACVGNDDEKQRQKRVIYHPGGHFLPSSQIHVHAVASFIKQVLGWEDASGRSDGGGSDYKNKKTTTFRLPIRPKDQQNEGETEQEEGSEERVENMKVPF
ncbi:MAG: hypothetical protein M1831_004531 [Alyxoria varia]|nr:MAG: hypothetical protein M1831_004531 [Alyxoria varia]